MVLGISPVIVLLTALLIVPVTGLSSAVTVVPYEVVKPYSKVTVVDRLLGLTVPLSVAPSEPTPLAASVVAVGKPIPDPWILKSYGFSSESEFAMLKVAVRVPVPIGSNTTVKVVLPETPTGLVGSTVT